MRLITRHVGNGIYVIHPNDLIIHPLAEAETIPADWYTHPDMQPLEKEAVFARSWQLVARESDLGNAGDHIVATIADEPLIIVRGKDNVLRGFFNVCRHRGGPLATENGCATHLQCKYHGWTYNLDGTLKATPDFDGVESFDKSNVKLPSIEVEVWQGLVFARIESGEPSLTELLDGINERLGDRKLGELLYHSRISYQVKCNWKVYVDNYLEGYHVPIVHPELVKLYDFRSYKTEVREWYSFQHSPLSGEENIYSSGDGEALYYFIWPNLMLNILPGRLQTNIVEPVDESNCIVHFDYYYAEGTTKEKIAQDLAFSHDVQHEDIDICEHVQRGLRSRSYHKGRFSVKREEAVYHFQNLLKSAFVGKI